MKNSVLNQLMELGMNGFMDRPHRIVGICGQDDEPILVLIFIVETCHIQHWLPFSVENVFSLFRLHS